MPPAESPSLAVATAYNNQFVGPIWESNPMSTVNLDALRAQVEILRWCKEREKEIADMKAQARSVVEAALGQSDAGTVDGELAITWRHGKVKRLNQKALKEKHPELVEEFTDVNEQRKFEIY